MSEPKTISSEDGDAEPLAAILARLAVELRNAAKDTDRLHRLVDSVGSSNVKDKHELIHSAQAIDAIEQTLSGLSDFVSALAALLPPDWEIDGATATRGVKLAALAARLADGSGDGRTDHPPGEFEFF